ncbi:mCG1043787, isoform CRA_a [Mus musculus]|nr:mCG1043787, isoform CRA_a [Mus musculus]
MHLIKEKTGKPRRRRTCETGQASAVICGKWLLVDQRYFPVSARVLCRQLRPCAEGPLSSATLHLGKTLWCRAGSCLAEVPALNEEELGPAVCPQEEDCL